jgi:2-polyprenyl-3-methyl-5-hydroxy-6-metoxy-1,4-benzoquinol methylase
VFDQRALVKRHYGAWAATYGAPSEGWFARVRAREIRMVRALLALRGRETILDVGCGAGLHALPLAEMGHEVWALDLAPEMIARVRGRVTRSFVADAEELALGHTFDRVLCLGVLEFVRDPEDVLARLLRHVRPGGRLVVLVPRTGPGGWLYRRTKRDQGLDARLFHRTLLEAMGTRSGAHLVDERTPFFHNIAVAYQLPPPPARAEARSDRGSLVPFRLARGGRR